jgi:hypothetical protein
MEIHHSEDENEDEDEDDWDKVFKNPYKPTAPSGFGG